MPTPSKKTARYTYSDYVTWSDEERWEIIGGEAFAMTPGATPVHQTVAFRLAFWLGSALEGRQCVPFFAPIDVVLSDTDVVQPDLLVVCDRSKIRPQCIHGAPDLVIEIASPSTALKDRRTKKRLYEKAGVKEYLVVEPEARYVGRFALGEDVLFKKADLFGPTEILELASLEGVELPVHTVFEVETEAPTSPSPRDGEAG